MDRPVYRRVLLKISGEALGVEAVRGLDFGVMRAFRLRGDALQRAEAASAVHHEYDAGEFASRA